MLRDERNVYIHRHFPVRFIILTILGCVLLSFPGCTKDTEQDRVKKIIAEVQAAAENKDIKTIINSLSKTYTDPQGFTYETMRGMILGFFFRHPKIHVYMTNLEVTVNGAVATAGFQALLSGGETGGSLSSLMPEALGLYAFEVSFKKESGEWKVMSAKWDRIGDLPSGTGR